MRVRLDRPRGYASKSADADAWRDGAKFCEAVKRRPKWWAETKSPPGLFAPAANGVYEGIYVAHLNRWRAEFPELRAYFSEAFFAAPAEGLRDALAFVGLDPGKLDVAKVVKVAHNTRHGYARGAASPAARRPRCALGGARPPQVPPEALAVREGRGVAPGRVPALQRGAREAPGGGPARRVGLPRERDLVLRGACQIGGRDWITKLLTQKFRVVIGNG